MKIDGDAAKDYRVVRLDSFENANKGELVSADEITGEVVFRDTPETTKTLMLGPSAIRILPK
jgi:hypothetical protein